MRWNLKAGHLITLKLFLFLYQGAKALEAFIYNIKNDPDKASNMPRDGTVHELTNHVRHALISIIGELDCGQIFLK